MSEKTKPELNTAQEPEDDFVSISGFFQFEEPGATLTGKYLGAMQDDAYEDAAGNLHTSLVKHAVLTDEGMVSFLETAELKKLRRVPPGTDVQIRYLSEEKIASGFRVKRFDIRFRRTAALSAIRHMIENKPQPLAIAAGPTGEADPFADE